MCEINMKGAEAGCMLAVYSKLGKQAICPEGGISCPASKTGYPTI